MNDINMNIDTNIIISNNQMDMMNADQNPYSNNYQVIHNNLNMYETFQNNKFCQNDNNNHLNNLNYSINQQNNIEYKNYFNTQEIHINNWPNQQNNIYNIINDNIPNYYIRKSKGILYNDQITTFIIKICKKAIENCIKSKDENIKKIQANYIMKYLKELIKGEWFVLICEMSQDNFDFKFTHINEEDIIVFRYKNYEIYMCLLYVSLKISLNMSLFNDSINKTNDYIKGNNNDENEKIKNKGNNIIENNDDSKNNDDINKINNIKNNDKNIQNSVNDNNNIAYIKNDFNNKTNINNIINNNESNKKDNISNNNNKIEQINNNIKQNELNNNNNKGNNIISNNKDNNLNKIINNNIDNKNHNNVDKQSLKKNNEEDSFKNKNNNIKTNENHIQNNINNKQNEEKKINNNFEKNEEKNINKINENDIKINKNNLNDNSIKLKEEKNINNNQINNINEINSINNINRINDKKEEEKINKKIYNYNFRGIRRFYINKNNLENNNQINNNNENANKMKALKNNQKENENNKEKDFKKDNNKNNLLNEVKNKDMPDDIIDSSKISYYQQIIPVTNPDIEDDKKLYDNIQKRIRRILSNRKLPQFNIDNYITQKSLGEGTYGKIISVMNKKSKKMYAMKEIMATDYNTFDDYLKTFEINNKNKHENILDIYGIYTTIIDEKAFLLYALMDLAECDWENEVAKRKESQNKYSEIELILILKQLVKALSFLQKQNIAHRDIKLENILIFNKKNNKNEKTYKICDFGEAKKNIKYNTLHNTVRGTDYYMSPELLKGYNRNRDYVRNNPHKSDVFSLGCCMIIASTLDYDFIDKIRKEEKQEDIDDIIRISLEGYYSEKFINIITKMIVINERIRIDFIDLEELIDKEFK